MRYTPDNEFRLFRLDVDQIILVIKLAHLTQDLLKFPTAILTHFALKLSKRVIYRLGRSERMLNVRMRGRDLVPSVSVVAYEVGLGVGTVIRLVEGRPA
jgi:hypothetical protein